MKKKLLYVLLFGLLSLALVACGGNDDAGDGGDNQEAEGNKELIVGATLVPHAEVLEQAKPLLKEKGIDLKIQEFTDYILPNVALHEKEIDANYYQTPGYLDLQLKDNPDFDFVSVGEIHKEPIGIYSKEYKNLNELPDGAKIIMSNSFSDHGRILPIFEREGIIKLKEGVGDQARVEDIVDNPKNLDFSTLIEAKLLATSFENGEGDAVVINTNYALEGGVNIAEDGIAFEGDDVVPANLIVVNKGDEEREEIKALVEVLKSEEIQKFIEEEYAGAVTVVE